MAKPTLGYWKIRGLAEPLRMILNYAEVDFEDKMYEMGDEPENRFQEWQSAKYTLGLEYPNLPYFIDGEYTLSEALAIYLYICEKYAPALLGTTPETRATASMLLIIAKEIKDAITLPAYAPNFHENIEGIIQSKVPKIEIIGNRLANSRFLTGDQPVHADFLLYETVENLDAIIPGKSAQISPNFEAFKQNFLTLNKMSEFVNRDRLPWNNKIAAFK